MELRHRTAAAPMSTSKVCPRRTPARERQTAISALRNARRDPRAYSYPAITLSIALASPTGSKRMTPAPYAVLNSTLSDPRPSADLPR